MRIPGELDGRKLYPRFYLHMVLETWQTKDPGEGCEFWEKRKG